MASADDHYIGRFGYNRRFGHIGGLRHEWGVAHRLVLIVPDVGMGRARRCPAASFFPVSCGFAQKARLTLDELTPRTLFGGTKSGMQYTLISGRRLRRVVGSLSSVWDAVGRRRGIVG